MVQIDHTRGSFGLWYSLPFLCAYSIEHFFCVLILFQIADYFINVMCNLFIYVDEFGIAVCKYSIFRRKRKEQRRTSAKGFDISIILCGYTGKKLIKHLPFPACPLQDRLCRENVRVLYGGSFYLHC